MLAGLPEQLEQSDVELAAVELGISRATLFRWVKQFREDGRSSALLPVPGGPKRGMQPMEPDVEVIVSRLFEGLYATRRKPTRKPTRTRFWHSGSWWTARKDRQKPRGAVKPAGHIWHRG